MQFWNLVTCLGESTYLLPSAIMIALCLCYHRAQGSAVRWLAVVVVTAGLTLISKLAFMGWGLGIPALDFTGFSGHSAMSAVVLPVLLYLCVPTSRPGLARFTAVCGIGLALLIGWSRLVLHAHSPSEVVSGLALGLLASVAFLIWSGRDVLPRSVAPLAAALLALTMLHVPPLRAATGASHRLVQSMAAYLSGRDRPYQRNELRALITNGQARGAIRVTDRM